MTIEIGACFFVSDETINWDNSSKEENEPKTILTFWCNRIIEWAISNEKQNETGDYAMYDTLQKLFLIK